MIEAIVTAPPYAPYLGEVVRHPLVTGLRLNTIMPVKGGPEEAFDRLGGWGVPLWVDLKGRQLRVAEPAIPPYTSLRVSHEVEVETPATVYLADGREKATVAAVDGDRLILSDGPRRIIGPGESVNIVHPSLRVRGTLTPEDRGYLSAMKGLGHRRAMLSFVENENDVHEVERLLPDVELLLKIESERGLAFARRSRARLGHLVAGRGDLFVEVGRPHRIVGALRSVISCDSEAWVASRLFESLARSPVPSLSDIADVAFLLALGYRRFVLGDVVCFDRNAVLASLDLLQAIAEEHDGMLA